MNFHKDRVTIYDIARKAGVSAATVSRVLTGKSNVNEITRQKVREVIEFYKYEPNFIARALNTKVSYTIGILIQELTNQFFINICDVIGNYAEDIGYTALIGITNNKYELELKLLKEFEKKQVDGFIMMGGGINDINPDPELWKEINSIAQRLPIVLINGQMKDTNCYIVRTDEKRAFKEILQYVIKCGHHKIGLITGQRGLWPTENKIMVFKNVLIKNRLKIQEEWILSGTYIVESGEESMNKILLMKERPTAVLCTNDILAIGAIRSVYAKKLSVPEDISILGFDDIFTSKYFIPGITTVQQNNSELAKIAVSKIVKHIAGEKVSKKTSIKAEMIIRDSCKTIK